MSETQVSLTEDQLNAISKEAVGLDGPQYRSFQVTRYHLHPYLGLNVRANYNMQLWDETVSPRVSGYAQNVDISMMQFVQTSFLAGVDLVFTIDTSDPGIGGVSPILVLAAGKATRP
jgi:hypothetical protein